MKKVFVIAMRYNDKINDIEKYVAGEFDSWINAKLFADIYRKHYNVDVDDVAIKEIELF